MSTIDVDKLEVRAVELENALLEEAIQCAKSSAAYGTAQALLAIAEEVRLLRNRLTEISTELHRHGSAPSEPVSGNSPKDRGGRRHSGYPRFEVQNGVLTKIGRGRAKGAREYRHEVERQHAEQVVYEIWRLHQRDGGPVRSSELNNSLAGKIPQYQLHVVIKGLCAAGLLRQEARGMYAVTVQNVEPSQCWRILEDKLQPQDARESNR